MRALEICTCRLSARGPGACIDDLTIFPEANTRAVVFGSRIRMITAANLCTSKVTPETSIEVIVVSI
jgi:hypothetical protein